MALLDVDGIEAFTMRSVAERLQINPMTIYHHIGDRDDLIEAMCEQVYSSVTASGSGHSLDRISGFLKSYHREVRLHPGLTLLIFSRPTIFPKQAERITEQIASLLVDAGVPPNRSKLWVDILVDFTHGAAIATAMGDRARATEQDGDTDGFAAALGELLQSLGSAA